MRDYGKILAQFWTGKTGKALRGHPEAQIVATYLISCRLSEMTGVYTIPLMYIAHETGLGFEGASKGLQRLIEVEFCTYEFESEFVFVHEMAKYQIEEELKPNDNRVKSVHKAYAAMPKGLIKQAFYARYKEAFHLPQEGNSGNSAEAPSKPLRSQEQEQEQEQNKTPPLPPEGEEGDAPKRGRKRSEEQTLQAFLDACKAKGERPMRDYTPLWDYTQSVGLSEDFVALAWAEFCRRFGTAGTESSQKQKDWRSKFRKCVEGNWYKLWAINVEGQYFLTTQGKQAEKFQEAKAA